ncbi:MAG: hypothetical protein ACE5FN_01655 [Leptospirillia bacterium]
MKIRHHIAVLLVVVLGCAFPMVPAAWSADQLTRNSSATTNNNMAAMRGFDPAVLTSVLDVHPDTSDMTDYLAGSTEFGYGLIAGTSDFSICANRIDCEYNADQNAFPGGNTAMPPAPSPLSQTGDSGYYFLSYIEDDADGALNVFKQGLRNDMLSTAVGASEDCDTVSAQSGQARCNEMDFGFHQEAPMIGQGSFDAALGGDGDQIFDLFFSVDALVDANGDLVGEAVGSFTQSYTDVTAGTTTSNSCSGTFTYSATEGYTQRTGAAGECP